MEELCQDVKWFTPKISLGTFQLLLTRLFFFLTEEPHWVEVLTEILLSLLTRQSSLYRHVVDHAFTVISPHLTSTALAMILEVCFSAIAFLVDFYFLRTCIVSCFLFLAENVRKAPCVVECKIIGAFLSLGCWSQKGNWRRWRGFGDGRRIRSVWQKRFLSESRTEFCQSLKRGCWFVQLTSTWITYMKITTSFFVCQNNWKDDHL